MAEQIKLVGVFDDKITPKLKALNKQLNLLNRKFKQFDRTLTGVNKKMKTLAKTSDRIRLNFAKTNRTLAMSSKGLRNYAAATHKAARAQSKFNQQQARAERQSSRRSAGRSGGFDPMAMMGGVGARGMGRMPARLGAKMGGKGGAKMAAGAMKLLPMVGGIVAGMAALGMAFRGITAAVNQAIVAGNAAEQQAIQMATTMTTLGGVKDFGKAMNLADANLKEVSQIAAKLPGATKDYANLLAQTMDDQIEAFGSLDAVQADLKKGSRSVTALLGVAGKLANLNPDMVGFDLMQLRVNPRNFRQSQILTRNPALMKFYQEGLEKFGGDYFKSLEFALKNAIPESSIKALTQTFDAQMEGLNTALFDPSSGFLGFARTFDMGGGTTNVMRELGKLMTEVNRILEAFLSTITIDPMEMLGRAISAVTYLLKQFADIYTKIVAALQPGYEAMRTAFNIIFDVAMELGRVLFDVVMVPFKLLGSLLGGVNEEFNLLKIVLGVVISPFVLLANVLGMANIAVLRFQEGLANLPFIGGMFGGKAAAKEARERREREQGRLRHLNAKFGELFGIIDEDAKEAKQASGFLKSAGLGGLEAAIMKYDPKADEKKQEEERRAKLSAEQRAREDAVRLNALSRMAGGSGVAIPGVSGTGGSTKSAKAQEKSQAKIQTQATSQAFTAGASGLVQQQVRTNDFLNKDLKAVRVYTHQIRDFQEEIFGALGVMMGMSKKQLRSTIKQYNTGAGGGPGGAAFMGGGGGFGAGPGMASGVQGGGGGIGSAGSGFGVDPNYSSNVMAAAEKNLGIMNGVAVQCANAMVAVHKSAGITTQVTKQAWDGMQSGEQLASRFFGDDVGQKIMGKENLKVGDMLAFKNTYGNWKDGTITHVGMYAGKNEAGEHMMYDHTKRGGLVKRKMSTFGNKFLYGSRLHGAAGAAAAGGPMAAGMGASGRRGSKAAGSGQGAGVGDMIMQDLMAMGMSKGQAAGIVGNLSVESDQFRADTEYAPNAHGTRGRGWAQWTGVRRKQFEAHAAKMGAHPTSYAAQMSYLKHELQGGGGHWTGGGSLRGIPNNAGAASDYFMRKFERPGVLHQGKRQAAAQRYFNKSYGSPVPAQRMQGAAPSSMGGAAGGGGGVTVQNQTVNVNGVQNAQQLSNEMARQTLNKVKQSSHADMGTNQ